MSARRMRSSRRTTRGLVVAAGMTCVGLVLASCSGSSSGQPGTSGGSGGSSDKPSLSSSGVSSLVSMPYGDNLKSQGTPKRGGTVVVGEASAVSSWDPAAVNGAIQATAIYDSLMRFNPKGQPVPYLAKSMSASDDSKVWTMKLRPGVKFQDGTAFNAAAIVFNIKRHQQNAASPAHAYTKLIKSVTAVNDLTVKFVLTEPLNSFSSLFCQPVWAGTLGAIVSPAAVKKYGSDYAKHPVGAGPFELTSWKPGVESQMKRNPHYWQKGLPYLDGVTFKVLPDTQTRDQSVASGTVDMISAAYFEELLAGLSDSRLKVYYGSANGASYLVFNFKKAPFNDLKMRKAVVAAINPDAMSKAIYRGKMAPAKEIMGEDTPYYSKQAAEAFPSFSQAEAKKEIAAYKASGGNPNFSFSTSNNPGSVRVAQFLQAQWKAVGLKVKIKTYDISTYITKIIQNKSGSFQVGTSILGPFISPYPWLNLLKSDGTANYGGYSNPKVDQLLNQAASTSDRAKSIAAYQQAQLIANKDVAYGWYSRSYLSRIAQKYVKGVVQDPTKDMLWATLWLDK